MRHFVSTRDLSYHSIISILNRAEEVRMQDQPFSKQLFAANLFFEPSTRTKMSFVAAQKKLGMETFDFHMETSSVTKGESLYDTAKTYEAIGANLLVIRHEADNWYDELTAGISIPIINAGAGKGEHPTQCMLDLLTIYQEFGTFKNVKVVIAGDIMHSRVARSNAYALKTLGAEVYLAAVPGFVDESMEYPCLSIDDAVEMCDVMMLLRIQHERHAKDQYDTTSYLEQFGLTLEREKKMKGHAIILHPAPVNRGVEIADELVECDRSRIFKQMKNGLYVRMALIKILAEEWGLA